MNLPQMIRNLWIYRRLIALAFVLGVVAWFLVVNKQEVNVAFPLVDTTINGPAGLVMLVSAGLGAVATWLVMMFRTTLRSARSSRGEAAEHGTTKPTDKDVASERPPGGNAGKEAEG